MSIPGSRVLKFGPSPSSTTAIKNSLMVMGRSPTRLFSYCFYSTTPTGRTKKPWTPSMNELYSRISSIADQKISIAPFLHQWIREGRPINKTQLREFITELRFHKRYSHALEISTWMTDNGYFELASHDVAIQLDLISRVRGIEQAQNRFNNIPQHLKVLKVYSALLNCHAKAKSVEKAEAVVQEMKSLGLANTSLAYNLILNFYYQTRNPDKIASLMQEMEEKGIGCDKFAFAIQLSAYASVSDIEGMEKTLTRLESNPSVILDWTTYTAAAKGYTKVGLLDRALEMLKKSEGLITGKKRRTAYDSLITLYAATRKKDEVLRIWELYRKNEKVYNQSYVSIIISLLKFDDFENAERIFEEWELQNSFFYDILIPNFLVDAYSRKGLMWKAEMLIDRAISKGAQPNARTWNHLSKGYLRNGQTLKAVEAMKKAVTISGQRRKLSSESLSTFVNYLKTEKDLEKAKDFIELLQDNDIISLDVQERLLNLITDEKSSSDVAGVMTDG